MNQWRKKESTYESVDEKMNGTTRSINESMIETMNQ